MNRLLLDKDPRPTSRDFRTTSMQNNSRPNSKSCCLFFKRIGEGDTYLIYGYEDSGASANFTAFRRLLQRNTEPVTNFRRNTGCFGPPVLLSTNHHANTPRLSTTGAPVQGLVFRNTEQLPHNNFVNISLTTLVFFMETYPTLNTIPYQYKYYFDVHRSDDTIREDAGIIHPLDHAVITNDIKHYIYNHYYSQNLPSIYYSPFTYDFELPAPLTSDFYSNNPIDKNTYFSRSRNGTYAPIATRLFGYPL